MKKATGLRKLTRMVRRNMCKIYMYDKYKIQEVMGEDGNKEYHIVSDDDMKPIEVHDTKEEAEESLKFWNQ